MKGSSDKRFSLWRAVLGRPLSSSEEDAARGIDREDRPLQRVYEINLLGLPGAWAVNELLIRHDVRLNDRIVIGLVVWQTSGFIVRWCIMAAYRHWRDRR